LSALRLQMRRDAALAWLDVWVAERALELIARQQSEAQIEIDALAIALRNNRAGSAEVSAARVALELLRDREQEQIGSARAARAKLARWIGERASAPLAERLPALPQPEHAEELARAVEMHPWLDAAEVRARIADTEAQLANLASQPDWSVEVAYARRASEFGDMVSLQFQVDLPILQARRQDRAVAARIAEARQARDLREDDLRAMRAAVLQLYEQWRTATARAQLFDQRVLPEARNSLQAATASYRSGKGRLSDVLAARRELLTLELEALMRRVDIARLSTELDYFSLKGT
jgi:outer membrane protein TolC